MNPPATMRRRIDWMMFERSNDVALHRRPAQVEKPVLEAHVLGIVDIAEHRHRQGLRLRQDHELPDADLDVPGRQFRVHGLLVTGDDPAFDRDDAFGTNALHHAEGGVIGLDDALGHAVLVAQVDEQEVAVIALAVNPSRKAYGRPDMIAAKLAACVRAITMHDRQSWSLGSARHG